MSLKKEGLLLKLNRKDPFIVKFASSISTVEKAKDSDDVYIVGYANTVNRDRAGDVIVKEAWEDKDALENYKKNPVILAYHDHSKPIGKMVEFNITDQGLEIKAKISKSAGDIYDLIKEGVLSTFSVGFGIKEAKYSPKDDTYYITKLELFEVSVVSVPCNQDSTFSVSKGMDIKDFEEFKTQLTPSQGDDNKGKQKMSFDLEKFKEEMSSMIASTVTTTVADAEKAKAEAEAKEAKAKADKAAKDKAAKEAAMEAAKSLVEEMESKMSTSNEAFAETVKAQQAEIANLKDEISQVIASRNKQFSYNPTARVMGGAISPLEKEIDDVVLLGMVTKTNMFETKFGKDHVTKVNTSSSIQVSSDSYETTFSTNLIRDIQAKLVVAPLFREISMPSANMTIPIQPGRQNANWVTAANYGTDASSGSELTTALTEITLTTYKLAAKSYITDETSEDAIIPLLPLIRANLVEAHANEIDRAFLLGDGTNKPSGLVTLANGVAASAATHVTTAKADGSVKVTAAMVHSARRKLGLYGVEMRDLALIISQEAYWDLIEDAEWANVNEVGAEQAVKLSGQVGQIYGLPVIVSNQFAAPAVDTAYAVIVNKTNFLVPRQRGATVRSDFDVEKDRRVIVATQRLNLAQLFADKGVVEIVYAAT